jgi:ubiquinol-cytochrome c reductase iron-sulfur subunit
MTAAPIDLERRNFLIKSTGALALAGATTAAMPFVASWSPTEATRLGGLPAKIDLSKLAPGEGIKFLWRGTPIWVVRRGPEVIANLGRQREVLKDPDSAESTQPAYANNNLRSRRDDVLVLSGICTHLGCVPALKGAGDAELGGVLQNGLVCPCHGSRFDLAGRVVKGSPAPINLAVPAYYFADDDTLVVGADASS